ncbi:MAG: DUF881 domain-containing protein [Corynebacteriales bacterium]|nr:DUF881 domain-containing protein [Mycobacteriales bacterium]
MNGYRDALAELLDRQLDHGYRQTEPRKHSWALRAFSAVTAVVIGLLIAVAYQNTQAAEPHQARTKDALIDRVHQQRIHTDELAEQADTLRDSYTQAQQEALAGSSSGQRALADLRELEALVGVAKVRGPGVVVTVGDGPVHNDAASLVQDRDVQTIVNALWFSGAEAISIDGQRLTPVSTIRTAGDAILVDFRPVTSPYEIKAIGDPATLPRTFRKHEVADRFFEYTHKYGMKFSINQKERLTLMGTTMSAPRYATGT